MSLVINTNLFSLIAQRSLATSNAQLAQAAQRLATGLRVNSARDDASGLAIATRLTTQIRGLNQGIRNLSDGISLAQTAEGGIDSITNNLQRLRELALQASNGVLSDADRAALQLEAAQIRSEIGRVATQTTFNGRPLLNGQLTAGQFQAGPNLTDVLPFAGIRDLSATALGFSQPIGETQLVGAGPGNVPGFTATNLNVQATGTPVAQTLTLLGQVYQLGTFAPGARDLAQAINALGVAGLSATNEVNVIQGTVSSSYSNFFDPEGVLTLNGVQITLQGLSTNSLSQNIDLAVTAINAVSNDTGVIASNGISSGQGLILTANDGRNITALFQATDINVTPTQSGAGPGNVPGFTETNIAVQPGTVPANYSITVLGENYSLGNFIVSAQALATAINDLGLEGLSASANPNVRAGSTDTNYQNFFDPAGILTLNGVEITLTGARGNTLSQNVDLAVAAINAVSGQTGVTASNGVAGGQGLVLTSAAGGNINVQFAATDINEDLILTGEGPGNVPGFIAQANITPGGEAVAQSVNVLGTPFNLGTFESGALNLANAINAAGIPGLSASAAPTSVTGTQDSSYFQFFDPQGILTINGVEIAVQGDRNNSLNDNVANAITAINAVSAETGVVATNGVGQGQGVILTAADGRTITVGFTATDINDESVGDLLSTAGNFGVSLTSPAGSNSTINLQFTAPSGVTSGQVTFSASTNLDTPSFAVVGSLIDNDPAPNLQSTAGNFGLSTTGPAGVGASFNLSFAAPTGVTEGTVQIFPGSQLGASLFAIEGSFNPDADPAPDFSTVAANFGITTTGANGVSSRLNVSFVAPEGVLSGNLSFGGTSNVISPPLNIVAEFITPTEFFSVDTLDVSTLEGASRALLTVDAALQTVNEQRAALGGLLNRLDSAIANLRISAENQIIARSRILDADLAAEAAAFARAQVLQQSGIALLTQANVLPFNVLKLLELR